MILQEEKFETYLQEAIPLMVKHNNEINLFSERLDLDFEQYFNLEKLGQVKSYTARNSAGKLIGYCIFLLYNHLHHSSKLFAHQDAIYIDPDYRTCGLKLLRYTEKELHAIGVSFILQAAPKISRLGKVLERLQYEELETIYVRRL